jgi:energy-coupling factor transport system ATP-binding protein
LDWNAGERLLLLGPSGGGKSTLALCLNGIIPHSLEAHWEAGRVLVDGQDTRAAGLAALTRQVGVLFQDPESQLVMLEVDDEIAFGLENLGLPRHEIAARIAAVRALVGLDTERTPARLDALSGGTKQRVVLAALLAMAGDGVQGGGALVLDEPTAHLDPAGAVHVLDLVGELCAARSHSLMLVEHRLDEVTGLIDRVAVLDDTGRLALEGPPDAVFSTHTSQLAALGVWTPQLAELTQLFDSTPGTLPHTPAQAAALLVERWPHSLGEGSGRSSLSQRETAEVRADHDGPAGGGVHSSPLPSGEGPQGSTLGGSRVVSPGVQVGQRSAHLLSAHELTYRYPGGTAAALDHVSLDVRAGEFLALVGANAAGKSTLGLLLAGVLRPSGGGVLLDGRDLRTVPEREVRARLSYVFQYPEHQFVAGSVRDEVLFGLRVRGWPVAAAERRAADALDRFGLAALAAANPYTLSHGQKRRLSVATALVTDPEVIVLDEPTFGQDRRNTIELLAALHELHRSGRTIVVITHDLALVAEHAPRALALSAGRIRFDGAPRVLLDRPEVLARCALRRPPIADAVHLARSQRAEIPPVISLPELRSALADTRAAGGDSSRRRRMAHGAG